MKSPLKMTYDMTDTACRVFTAYVLAVLYIDEREDGTEFWNRDKEWDVDFLSYIAERIVNRVDIEGGNN